MKILHLNTYDVRGGAAIAAHQLHKSLLNAKIDSFMLVQKASIDDNKIISVDNFLKKYLGMLPRLMYPDMEKVCFNCNYFPSNLARKINSFRPDIVHLHWIGENFLSIATLKRIKCPIIWTMHDMWPFTGGCHYSNGCQQYQNKCGNCPILHSHNEKDLSRFVWQKKNKEWQKLNFSLVSPSDWLSQCAKKSSLFKSKQVNLIPNGVDINLYHPIDKTKARELLKIPLNKTTILFGAMNATSDKRKGFHYLSNAFNLIQSDKKNIQLLLFGTNKVDDFKDFESYALGDINDRNQMALIYSAADLIIIPSVEDNLPNVALEAMACGVPCVAFKIGGMADIITHLQDGYLAKPFDITDLANGIDTLISEKNQLNDYSKNARLKIVNNFNEASILQKYIKLYKEKINLNKI